MSRKIINPIPHGSTPAAEPLPNRYPFNDIEPAPETLAEARKQAPYARGDVVLTLVAGEGDPVKARVLAVLTEFDSYGFPRHFYRVQVETKAGRWSALWATSHPGWIQGAYARAGLAPDIPERLR